MESGKKYTALEILQALKIPSFFMGDQEYSAEDIFGKGRIIIGGIRGIVKADHMVHIQKGTKELEVIVGVEKYTLTLEDKTEE